jgi:phage/plasmid-associated DNA primase
MEAIQRELAQRFGITNALFQNLNISIGTLNINTAEDDHNRHTEGQLNDLLLGAHPTTRNEFKFCPSAKHGGCNGMYACDAVTRVWDQVPNASIELWLRDRYVELRSLTPEDRRYVTTRRGITDLRAEFVNSMLDREFESRLDSNLDIFALKNGIVVDMRTRTRRATRPDDYVRLNAGWDYSTELAILHRPAVEAFLEQLMPVQEERDVALTYLAGLLSGRRVIKKLMALTDKRAGNNGKSTLVALLKTFFGDFAKFNSKFFTKGSFDQDRNAHDAGMEPFVGVRLAVLEELKRTTRLDEGLVKLLTGGSDVYIQGRCCGSSDNFRFTWQAGFVMVFNEGDCPSFDVGDEAFVGRLLVMPMRSRFVCADDLSSAINQEDYTFVADANVKQHFPAWCSALLDVLLDRYTDTDLATAHIPASMAEWRAGIVEGRNALGEWLQSTIVRIDDQTHLLFMTELKQEYRAGGGASMPPGEFIRAAKAWFMANGYTWKDIFSVRQPDGTRKSERNLVFGAIVVRRE